jgi:hypothetical protein
VLKNENKTIWKFFNFVFLKSDWKVLFAWKVLEIAKDDSVHGKNFKVFDKWAQNDLKVTLLIILNSFSLLDVIYNLYLDAIFI